MEVREDGSGLTENDRDEVCFEFKGPIYWIRNIRRMSITQSRSICHRNVIPDDRETLLK